MTNNTKDVELMLKMLAAIENGFQIFYKCLRETQHICPGHREVANLLKIKGIIFDSWPCFYCYITAPPHGFPSTKYPLCPEDDDIKVSTLICDVNRIYCVGLVAQPQCAGPFVSPRYPFQSLKKMLVNKVSS